MTTTEAAEMARDAQKTRETLLVGQARIEERLQFMQAGCKDHETRLRSVERRVHFMSGAAAVAGAVGGRVLAFFGL